MGSAKRRAAGDLDESTRPVKSQRNEQNKPSSRDRESADDKVHEVSTFTSKGSGTATKANGKKEATTLEVIDVTGSLFNAPSGAILVHACNTKGSWGAGIAKAFRQNYSNAYQYYRKYCEDAASNRSNLVGSALLISPDRVGDAHQSKKASNHSSGAKQHFVGCLFTSDGFGRGRDSPEQILNATAPAMADLMSKIEGLEGTKDLADGEGEARDIWMCRINSGLFGVPWEKTKAELESIDVSALRCKSIKAVTPSDGKK